MFSIWFSDKPDMPELIKRCIESQRAAAQASGYRYALFTLDTIPPAGRPKYFQECVDAKKWAKAADFARIGLLYAGGGIYLDADVEMLPGKNFDDMLHHQIFCGKEENNFSSNAIIGAHMEYPMLKKYLDTVEANFIGSGDLVFQPGMFLWTEMIEQAARLDASVKIYPPEYFLPYNHHIDRLLITENSRCIHHFSKSWLPKL